MSNVRSLIAAVTLVCGANSLGQSAAPPPAESLQWVAACNAVTSSTKRRAVNACEALEQQGRLALVEPAALVAYRSYQQARREACERRLASPRGAARGQTSCGP
jgi:hypothetical protein